MTKICTTTLFLLVRVFLQKVDFCNFTLKILRLFPACWVKKIVLAHTSGILLLASGGVPLFSESFRFQEGDIVFQEIKNSTSKAIKIVTDSRYTHAGVILKYRNKFIVLESNRIVRRTDLYQFLKKGVHGAYLVKRFKNPKDILTEDSLSKMREASSQFVGKPYDLYYGWGDEKLYSAELIWKFWKEALQLEICPLKKYKDYDLSNPYVKLILSQKFGKDIPLEETVVFPKDILQSPHLETVFPKGDLKESLSIPENSSPLSEDVKSSIPETQVE